MAELSSTTKEHAHKPPGPSASAGSHASVSGQGLEVDVGVPEEGLVARHAALVGDPRLGSPTGAQRMRLVQRLQRGYGNAYVARLVQRAVAEPPNAPAPATPEQDPKFVAVEQKIGQTAKQEKQHPPAKAKAAEAQAAAQGPPNDVASQAAEKQVDKMSQQKPGEFDKKAFIAAVKKAIEASAPKNLEEADDFKKSGKAGQVKGEVSGMVGKGKQDSEGPIKKANTESPDTSTAKPKVVTPMGDEKPGAAPPDPGAAQAIPSPKSAAETSMAAGPAQVNQEMGQAGVTEEQLKNSNEPQFTDAAAAKQGAEEHSKTAPQEYKAAENQTLDKAGADAKGAAGTALHGMHGDKQAVLGAVGGQKGGAKSKDEAKRAEVAAKIEAIFNQTKTEVTAILDGLDAKVNTAFDAGEKDARAQFETYVDQKMTKFKDDRYSGFFGGAKWLKDKLMGMPSEVNAFYADGRNLYLSKMEGVISNVADVVGGELGKAKARIALGKQQVKEFVSSQPKELQQVAKDAEQQIGGKFDELEGEVNSKQDSLVQTLADKYVAARGELDSRIDALKAENKGFVDKAIDAIGGVIKTILQLKDMLLGVLAKAANVIGDIIKDPIKFLGNLVSAIKMGLNQFGANIEKHLKAALMGWLFGTLGEAGIKLPESFDLKGILSLILQVLGLTYENVRAIAVKIAGEKVVAFVEGTVTFFTTLAKEGPAGLWQWIKDKIAELNLKEMVLGAIKDFVITKIITAGITWLISMLNPAAAFIKACKMIYDVIMFVVERGAQIMEFVNSVLDGIGAIVAGSLGSAATLVENSLAKVLPLAIAFLASLLGVGGIAEKIKDIIEKIRAPITKLITAVVGPILKPMKALYAKGAKFVKGLAEKGKDALKKGADKVKGLFGKGKPDDKKGGAAAPGKETNVEAKKDLAMAGEGHTVSAHVHQNQFVITMASAQEIRLESALRGGISELQGSDRADKHDLIAILQRALTGVVEAPHDFYAQEARDPSWGPVSRKEFIELRLARIANELLALSPFKIKSLQQLSAIIHMKRFLPPGFDVRARLYVRGSSWATTRQQLVNTELTGIREKVSRAKSLVKTNPAAASELWLQLKEQFKIPVSANFDNFTIADVHPDLYHVDHIYPLSKHWSKPGGGHDGDDSDRWGQSDASNLRVITAAENLRKGSSADDESDRGEYVREVGANFTSHYAEGGQKGARTIDGQPLTDKAGNPLP